MTASHRLDRFKTTKKKVLFKLFVFAIIEWICLNLYFVISGLTGSFEWPILRLTSTIEGLLIQIIQLVAYVFAIVITVYVILYIALLLKGSE